jgi:hypothetical protein
MRFAIVRTGRAPEGAPQLFPVERLVQRSFEVALKGVQLLYCELRSRLGEEHLDGRPGLLGGASNPGFRP